MSHPIADRVSDTEIGMSGQLPIEALAAFAAERDGLRRDGVPTGVATPGARFPDGELIDVSGRPTSLRATADGRAVVVVFYRGAWCPYCNLALRTYQEHLVPGLAERGVGLVAVSPQRPDGSLTMAQTNALSFSVLSDPGNVVARALGIVTRPTTTAREAQQSLGLDITEGNADGTDELPMPTTVLVDESGVIRWIDVHPDYSTRTEPADVLGAIDRSA